MTDSATAPAIDFSSFDPDTRVQDDLFRHVNGHWLEVTEIPADKPMTGAFIALRDNAEAAVRDIITTIEPDESRPEQTKIADLYASFMDESAIEAAGAQPLSPLLAAVDAVETPTEFIRLLGSFARSAVSGLIGVDTESDPGNPNRYVMFAGQGGIGLPDEEYYRLDTYAEIRAQYQDHIAASFELAGVDDPAAQAQRVLDLETLIAGTHWDKVRCRDHPADVQPAAAGRVHRQLPRSALA